MGAIFGDSAEKLLASQQQPRPAAVNANPPSVGVGKVSFELPSIDFTPASLITLLFTDLGVFTPAAVSDELIRLYQ